MAPMLATLGTLGHPLFFIVLSQYFHEWKSFSLRMCAVAAHMSQYFFRRGSRAPLYAKIHWEISMAFALPFFFNFMLVKNNVDTYWASSVIFCTIPYGLMANAATSVPIFLLSAALGAILPMVIDQSYSTTSLFEAAQINFAAAFMVLILSVVQTVLRHAFSLLDKERERSDALIHNILPSPIADRLKSGASLISDRFESVSVMFADIVGFTRLAETKTPEELITLLDGVFSKFDQLAKDKKIEKIKTIGDAYMAVAGLPEPTKDNVEKMLDFALALQSSIQQGPGHLQIRIGVNVGPVVAGVIGHHKFSYDVWGDTVNTASRMKFAWRARENSRNGRGL